MKDLLRRCLHLGDRIMHRFEGALGGLSLGIVAALALTFTGLIKAWFFTHIGSVFLALLVYGVVFTLCGGVGLVLGVLFPRVFRIVLIPFIPLWFLVFGGDSDGPFYSAKTKPRHPGSLPPRDHHT